MGFIYRQRRVNGAVKKQQGCKSLAANILQREGILNRMNFRISLGAAIALLLVVAALTFSITMTYSRQTFNDKVNDLKEREEAYAKFSEIDTKVRQSYNGVIDQTQLMDSVAKGYIAGIGDKNGSYIDSRAYERLMRNQNGEIAGIGTVLRVNSETGYLLVEEVYPDSPAQNAGIEPGDLIVKINNIDLTRENGGFLLESVQGEPGTKLALVVRRGAEERIIDDLTRRQVIVPSVFSRMLNDTSIGYIWIKEFSSSSSDQFNRELQKLRDAGVQALIFDVRDTKGGRMKSATRILDKLLPAGPLVSATYKDGTIQVLETSDANSIDMPMVVLQNAGTSGYAELFVQALKDYNMARSVGALTAGMGSMQEMIKLSDGSAIEITIAHLNAPSGETYNNIGVKPDFDVAIEGSWQEQDETTDAQLKKAIEVAIGAQKVKSGAETATADTQTSSAASTSAASASSAVSSTTSSTAGAVSSAAEEIMDRLG